jgi:hypothetical protein
MILQGRMASVVFRWGGIKKSDRWDTGTSRGVPFVHRDHRMMFPKPCVNMVSW